MPRKNVPKLTTGQVGCLISNGKLFQSRAELLPQ